jgi:hypothetical protein
MDSSVVNSSYGQLGPCECSFPEDLAGCAVLFLVLSKFTQCIASITKAEIEGEGLDSYLVS